MSKLSAIIFSAVLIPSLCMLSHADSGTAVIESGTFEGMPIGALRAVDGKTAYVALAGRRFGFS